MSKGPVIDHDPATSSSRKEDRVLEMQNWDKEKAVELAKIEGIVLTDAHWEIVDYLRSRYLEQGVPESARDIADDLESIFADKGGNKFLRRLFPNGPVTQGCKIAGLQVPAYSTDPSFGTTY